jgi:hypothetical protein
MKYYEEVESFLKRELEEKDKIIEKLNIIGDI